LLVLGVLLVGLPGLLLANTVAASLKTAAPALLFPLGPAGGGRHMAPLPRLQALD
jgi:hypothetical protein